MNNGAMFARDIFGSDLSTSHPFSLLLPLADAPDLAASLVANQKTADPLHKVTLIAGNVECTSCHNAHVQGTDTKSQNFLVRDSSSGQMCLACHDPNRTVTGQANPLAGWASSMHATAVNPVMSSSNLGGYETVATTACLCCHTPHKAAGAARVLRTAVPALPSVDPVADPTTQPCLTCHAGGANLKVAAPNIYNELSKPSGHPYPAGSNLHDAAESLVVNAAVLKNNRHATCADCHNPHDSNSVGTMFPAPPTIRISQSGVVGVSASDGTTVLNPAVNQFENCLRCHGTSTGKQILAKFGYPPSRIVTAADSLNVISQFSSSATSSHPVTHDSSSTFPQPSLRTYMMKMDGTTQARLMGQRILCTDCHNSDDNREFSVSGGGPNGPHGSIYPHILERRYEFSQAATSGQAITNLFPTPDLTATGPYALCAKCHNLTTVVSNTNGTFSSHSLHVQQWGFSCSVCHSAHGMGSVAPTVSGQRLVNFDANVVAQNGNNPITYTHAPNSTSNNTCVLQCHGYNHNADGSVSVPPVARRTQLERRESKTDAPLGFNLIGPDRGFIAQAPRL
jgi:predicted CXXCH cytochrome family protein